MNDKIIVGAFSLEEVLSQKTFKAFDDEIVHFLNELSVTILSDPDSKKYSDLASFGFFVRRANLVRLRKQKVQENAETYVGIGATLHIAPSNVPLNFAYSLVTALLCGNPSIVRISSKHYNQAEILIDLINSVVKRLELQPFFTLIKYPHDSCLNVDLSKIVRVRVIWGGNDTITHFKNMEVKPNVVDITFPNKYSLTLIDANYYASKCDYSKVARDFYNEVYTFDQNACTSPRAVVWIGDKRNVALGKEIFWSQLAVICSEKDYQPSISAAVNQFAEYSFLAAKNLVIKNKSLWHKGIRILAVKKLTVDIFTQHPGEGLFYEVELEDFQGLQKLITDECQTITTVGHLRNELIQWISNEGVGGIEKICKLGTASNFSIDWDGKDLFRMMTRRFQHEDS